MPLGSARSSKRETPGIAPRGFSLYVLCEPFVRQTLCIYTLTGWLNELRWTCREWARTSSRVESAILAPDLGIIVMSVIYDWRSLGVVRFD